jgi:hypothetical protein
MNNSDKVDIETIKEKIKKETNLIKKAELLRSIATNGRQKAMLNKKLGNRGPRNQKPKRRK